MCFLQSKIMKKRHSKIVYLIKTKTNLISFSIKKRADFIFFLHCVKLAFHEIYTNAQKENWTLGILIGSLFWCDFLIHLLFLFVSFLSGLWH